MTIVDDIKNAIKYFEDAITESDEIIAERSKELQKELGEQRKHFVVAVTTMKLMLLKKGITMKPCYRCGREGMTMIVMHKECYEDMIRKIAEGNELARKVEALKKKLEVEDERENI